MSFLKWSLRASTELSSPFSSVRLRRWLLRGLPLAVTAFLAGGYVLPASAGTNGLDLAVVALPGTVSLGSPNLAAYKFTISNNQSSGVNNVWLNADSSVVNGGGNTATFKQSIPSFSTTSEVCQFDSTQTQVSCALGSIAPGASVSIVLIFNSPSQGSEIDVTNWIPAGQGGPSPVPGSNAFNLNTVSTQLVAATTGNVKRGTNSTAQSYVLAGGSLSAGTLKDSGAQFLVSTLPTGQGVVIKQFVPPSSCSSMYKTCFNGQLDITDNAGVVQFANRGLTIVLTRAASTLKGTASIDNAVLQYYDTSLPAPAWVDILACPDTSSAVNCYVPFGGHKGQVDAAGNWIFTLNASQNGLRAY